MLFLMDTPQEPRWLDVQGMVRVQRPTPWRPGRQSPGRRGDATICKPPEDGRVVVEPHAAKARVVMHAVDWPG